MTHQAFQSASRSLDREFPTWTAHKAYSGNQPACALNGSRQLKYSLLSTQGLSAKEDHAVAIYSELTAKLATAVALDLRDDSAVSAGVATDVLCQPLTGAAFREMGQGLGDVQTTQWHRLQQEESVSPSSCEESANPWEVLS